MRNEIEAVAEVTLSELHTSSSRWRWSSRASWAVSAPLRMNGVTLDLEESQGHIWFQIWVLRALQLRSQLWEWRQVHREVPWLFPRLLNTAYDGAFCSKVGQNQFPGTFSIFEAQIICWIALQLVPSLKGEVFGILPHRDRVLSSLAHLCCSLREALECEFSSFPLNSSKLWKWLEHYRQIAMSCLNNEEKGR